MPLRFDELTPREFEELCLALLRAEGHSETRYKGGSFDRGWDLKTRNPEGRVCCVQCKRKPRVGPADAVRELEKAWSHYDEHRFDVWMLMASADLGAITEERLAEVKADCRIELVGKSDLEGRIREHPRVLDRFFAGDSAKAQVAYLSACKADRDLASQLRGDLQANLRAHVGQSWNVRWHDPTGDHGTPEIPEAAAWGIVIVSPEALADRRLSMLWQGAMSQGHSAGRRQLLAVSVAPTVEWPSWLAERFDRIDLHPETYRADLSKILSKWIGRTEDLADRLDIDDELPSPRRLDPVTHQRLVDWLTPVMESKMKRQFLAHNLGLDGQKVLDDFSTPALQASAAVVLSRQDDDPVRAILRLIGVVRDVLEDEESSGRMGQLNQLADDLRAAQTPTTVDLGLLPSWLRKVRDDHERLVDFFQRRHELDLLDRVYVELEMSPDRLLDGRSETVEQRLVLEGRSLGIEDVLALDPDKHAWVTRRWVVRGDPGSGKTTLLRHLAAKLASDDVPRWVPVFQSLPTLVRSREPLLDRIEREMATQTKQAGLGAVLDREGQEGRLLLLLDGLDEVGDQRDEAEGLLRRLADRWPASPIVVSTRPIGYRRFSQDFRDLQLLPLDEERRFEFLANWLGRAEGVRDTEQANTAMQQLNGAGFDELAGNPLYLTLMAMLLEQGTAPDQNRSVLYRQVFELLIERRYVADKADLIERPQLVREALRLLAYTMTVDNLDAERRSALQERFYREELAEVRDQIKRVSRWDGPLHLFLDDLAAKVGILGPHDGRDAEWKFWHRTFKEALTAEHLASLSDDRRLEQVAGLAGQESRWAEPYALLTGQVEEPDALVRNLVEVNRSLGLRALATAQGVSNETLDEILKLTDNLDERSKVLEQLPTTVGDPDRALKLIDRLRQRTRDGFDLFWLYLAAGRLAELDDDYTERVRDFKSRFFDHMPPPDPALFQSFQMPDGTTRPLWCDIPAATYWVGCPEDERGREDDEAWHRVELLGGYRMAAVPVTNAQYASFDPGLACHRTEAVAEDELPHHPRVNVTWFDAVSFCRWLATGEELGGARLPRDPEWEIACRAGTETAYWKGGDRLDLAQVDWFRDNAEGRAHRVAGKLANGFGLFDVHGNVREWLLDSAGPRPLREPGELVQLDPNHQPAPIEGSPHAKRLVGGGGYRSAAGNARSASRITNRPGSRWEERGFRVLLPATTSS